MSERRIGKITAVDSFRIVVQLDDELKSLYKSGFNDIYEIARINSYLIIPVGADRIVSIITRVKIQDETELEKSSGFITLPKAQRYLIATMIGTIEAGDSYKQGVFNYPILDNPVWYVTKEDLDRIFDTKENLTYDYDEDYFLPIGTSPAFTDYQVKINPDKFFGKHAAVLGNTGSGKSCTVASIVQSMFKFKYNDNRKLQCANFIFFDTNGEYKKAFGAGNEDQFSEKELINPMHISKEGLKVPYWFMNYDDMEYLFQPSANTQAPIFKRAIGLAKNSIQTENTNLLSSFLEAGIVNILDASTDEIKKKKCKSEYGNWNYKSDNEIKGLADAIPADKEILKDLKAAVTKLSTKITVAEENAALEEMRVHYSRYLNTRTEHQISVDKNIDLPIWFNFKELLGEYIDHAIDEQEGSSNRIKEFISTLRLRLQSYYNDQRISDPILLKQQESIEGALYKFLAFILGDYCKVHKTTDKDLYSSYCQGNLAGDQSGKLNLNKPSQITILDMSLLPYEVLETVTGLIGRLILEFLSRFSDADRGNMPTVIVLEEAQNYIPEKDKGEKPSIAKKIFERIAREGRKYGLSLLVSSQRPSELSKTVLSQCNSFVIHRLQNPEDQKYVRQLVSAANEDILQQLPILPQQHAVIMGDGVRTPVQVKMNNADPKPNSSNPQFVEKWLSDYNPKFPDYIGIAAKWENGENDNLDSKNNEDQDDDDLF